MYGVTSCRTGFCCIKDKIDRRITKSSKGVKEVNLGLFLFHWDETIEELFCSSRNPLQVEEEIKTTKYLTFFSSFGFLEQKEG